MLIVIDMQGAQTESRFRGIGRYTISLVKAIVRNRGAHEIILALNGLFPETIEPIRSVFNEFLPQENIRIWHAPGPTFEADPINSTRRRVAELIREEFLQSLNPDFVLVSSLFEGLGDNAVTSIGQLIENIPTAVVLYDLIPLLRPDAHFINSKIHQDFYARKIESLKRSHCLLAISESAREEALEGLSFDENKIVNISAACDASFKILNVKPEEAELLCRKIGISRPFVLYTGGADERKNLHSLIEAYSGLPKNIRMHHQLVFAGKMPLSEIESLKNTAKRVRLEREDIIFTGYISDNDLIIFYNICKVFIFPSLHEGFGLPPLEAMACGAPTIAADATSLVEVVGLASALFDPASIESISNKLLQALEDEEFRMQLVKHAHKQIQRFSWDKTAKTTIITLERLIKSEVINKNYALSIDSQNKNLLKALAALPLKPDDLYSIAQSIADNEVRIGLPQLLLDVSTIVHSDAKSGIQRVVRSVLQELLTQSDSGYVVRPIYFDGHRYRYADQLLGDQKSEAITDFNSIVSFWPGDTYLSLDLNMHLVSVIHSIHENMRRQGVYMNYIVYDLLLATNPEWWNAPNPELFTNWLKSVCVLSDNIICISNTVANELRAWLESNPVPRKRGAVNIKSFYLGADIEGSKRSHGLPAETEKVLAELSKRPTFLMVGTLEPRKGHAVALAAIELLWKQDVQANLVIVGKKGWLVDDLVQKLRHHPELNQRLFWLEGISDEYLEKIYLVSTCLLAASYDEGFGLPLIEAAQHKIPIIARDIPVFREVAGEHAFYFNANAPRDLTNALSVWLDLHAKGKSPQSTGMTWLKWKQSVAQLTQAINRTKVIH